MLRNAPEQKAGYFSAHTAPHLKCAAHPPVPSLQVAAGHSGGKAGFFSALTSPHLRGLQLSTCLRLMVEAYLREWHMGDVLVRGGGTWGMYW